MVNRIWKQAFLSEICLINPGKKELQDMSKEMEVSFLPMASVSEDGKILVQQRRKLKEVIKGYTNFREGDVLLAKITPCFENGKRAIARNLTNGVGFGSTEFHVLRPGSEVTSDWIFHAISRPDFCHIAKSQMTGTAGQKRVPARVLEQFKIPIPTTREQERISENIETQFTRLDAAIKSLKTFRNNLEFYRVSVLKASFKPFLGRLDKFTNFVEIMDNQRAPVNKTEREKRKGDIPYYGATGQVGLIDDYLFNEELVLLGEDGAPFLDPLKNKAYLINGKSWVNNHAHVLKGKNGLKNKFLMYWLNTVDYRPYVGGTTRLKLNQSQMRNIPIPVISGDKQDSVLNFIESRFSVIDKVESVIDTSLVKAEMLRKAILKAAFEGKLVAGL